MESVDVDCVVYVDRVSEQIYVRRPHIRAAPKKLQFKIQNFNRRTMNICFYKCINMDKTFQKITFFYCRT